MKKYVVTLVLASIVVLILYFSKIRLTKLINKYGNDAAIKIEEYIDNDISSLLFSYNELVVIHNNCINDQKTYFDYQVCLYIKDALIVMNDKTSYQSKYGELNKILIKLKNVLHD